MRLCRYEVKPPTILLLPGWSMPHRLQVSLRPNVRSLSCMYEVPRGFDLSGPTRARYNPTFSDASSARIAHRQIASLSERASSAALAVWADSFIQRYMQGLPERVDDSLPVQMKCQW